MQKFDGLSCRTSHLDLVQIGVSYLLACFLIAKLLSKFSVGKTKCAYFINYDIVPHFKNILTKAITESPFYSPSFDERLNAVVQSSQRDVGICYRDDVKNFVQT